MHELTIAAADGTGITTHHDFDAAFRVLMRHVIAEDLYLHPQPGDPRAGAVFALVALEDTGRDSRIVGTATITESAPNPVAAIRWGASAS